MPWKCICGHYNDVTFRNCLFCERPKPGTVDPDKMEYKIIFNYLQSGKQICDEKIVKGPISISTDVDHKRLHIISQLQNGVANEICSIEWDNSIAHGKPIQVLPIQEGGFYINSNNEQLMINGEMPSSTKVQVPITVILTLSSTMLIRIENSITPSFIHGALTPVGRTIPDGVSPEILYKLNGAYYYNGLNEFYSSLYETAGVKRIQASSGDMDYINKMILTNNGFKIKERRDELVRLKG